MSNLFWLTDEQMTRLKPFSPKSHGHPRVDDRRVLSGIIFVSRNGSRWCDVPKEYGRSAQDPLQSLEAMERDGRLRPDLRGAGVGRSRANAHHDQRDRPEGAPHSVEPSGEKGAWTPDRSDEGRNEHQAARGDRHPRTSDQVLHVCGPGQRLHWRGSPCGCSDCWGMTARRSGFDADGFREALQNKGIRVCIPGRKARKVPVKYDKRGYKRRSRIEMMFGRLKDWRRVATRSDSCPRAFLSHHSRSNRLVPVMSPQPSKPDRYRRDSCRAAIPAAGCPDMAGNRGRPFQAWCATHLLPSHRRVTGCSIWPGKRCWECLPVCPGNIRSANLARLQNVTDISVQVISTHH